MLRLKRHPDASMSHKGGETRDFIVVICPSSRLGDLLLLTHDVQELLRQNRPPNEGDHVMRPSCMLHNDGSRLLEHAAEIGATELSSVMKRVIQDIERPPQANIHLSRFPCGWNLCVDKKREEVGGGGESKGRECGVDERGNAAVLTTARLIHPEHAELLCFSNWLQLKFGSRIL
ncbi:hypothetical protein EYF80_020011 [Liparis tanakae]|uniref:Uncharacterized protein n=1 Tax=Liparis tanakae TaxID=230148 RepID=A0A4Z2HVB3_9TELE|nr:hypothetical protein EYF80_020011 [Liparis tanakae]